jgi:ferredoxin
MKRVSVTLPSVVSKTRSVLAPANSHLANSAAATTLTRRSAAAGASSASLLSGIRWGTEQQQVRTHLDVLTGDRTKPAMQLTFILPPTKEYPEGEHKTLPCYPGQNLLEIAQEHHLPMEGACAGSCACSTCHVYLDEDGDLEKFPEAEDAELDMLDLAFYPTANSRLGCQLTLTAEHDGMKIQMPKATRNMAVDGYVATPH